MAFDPTKPVRTRDERAARIVDTFYRGRYLIAVVKDEYHEGGERIVFLNQDGKCQTVYAENHKDDLVNIPERRSHWANVYGDGYVGQPYSSLVTLVKTVERRASARLELVYEDDKLVEVIKHDVSND